MLLMWNQKDNIWGYRLFYISKVFNMANPGQFLTLKVPPFDEVIEIFNMLTVSFVLISNLLRSFYNYLGKVVILSQEKYV